MKIRTIGALLALSTIAAACTEATGNDPGGERAAAPSPSVAKHVERDRDLSERGKIKPADNWLEAACELPFEQIQRIRRGLDKERSPEIIFVPREPNYFGGFTSFTHSGPWDYVQDIPIAFYGPGFIRSQGEIELDRPTFITDIAPTIAELLDTPFPAGRPGTAITEALLPPDERAAPKPKLVLTVVWDGGGWNVLNAWPRAWPNLKRMMQEGTSVANATVGSSPSVTPAMHTNLGTGAWPKRHGIVDIPLREGTVMGSAFNGREASELRIPTLADLYDRRTGNRAKVGMFAYKSWHLGMIGHGALVPGGDKDIAIIAERTQGDLVTNTDYYSLPPYLEDVPGFEDDVRRVDLDDGKVDDTWMGHEILNDPNKLRHSPVWALYQTRLLKELLRRERYGADSITDLFFINYKQIDDVGHDYNMLNPETREILLYTDETLPDIERSLNRTVGRDQWVMVITADHGQGPDPQEVGAWPIRIQPLSDDIAEHFGTSAEALFDDERPVGFWPNFAEMDRLGITYEDLSNYLIDYRLKQNTKADEKLPAQYEPRLNEPIFAAAFPRDQMGRIWKCATESR